MLYGKTLTYYKSSKSVKPLNTIDLSNSRGVRPVEQCNCNWPASFDRSLCFGLALEARTFYLLADNEEECRCVL